MSKKPKSRSRTSSDASESSSPAVATLPPDSAATPTRGPQFAEPTPTPDPKKFSVKHGSDSKNYSILDSMKGKLKPRDYPINEAEEPQLKLADALGPKGSEIVGAIQDAGQIVFHVCGDTGNTRGPADQSMVADKMVSDFNDPDPRSTPSFMYHVGDVVYSFGEEQYYYDQFYEPYRDYPAPIFAIPGNHDGMVAPLSPAPTLQAFLQNFCTAGQPPHTTPEAGGLARTAQIQPGVYFTLEAPFVRILGLYSNCLEDPGIISDQGGTYPNVGSAQTRFLRAALQRVKDDKFAGAVIIAVHHPPYVAQLHDDTRRPQTAGRHGGSPQMLDDIDAACKSVGIWPHALLCGHAHNQQRFTRYKDGRETPYIVIGNSGHAHNRLGSKNGTPIRVPVQQESLSDGNDKVVFESYDDQDFGYLRVIVDKSQLRLEYHPASDGDLTKAPDDFVTVDLATRKLKHFQPQAPE